MDNQFQPEMQNSTNSRTATFIISIVLLVLGTIFSGLSSALFRTSRGDLFSAFGLGYVLGSFLGPVIIALIVIFFIFRSKSTDFRANGMLVLSIIFIFIQIISAGSTLANIGKEYKQSEATKEALVQMMNCALKDQKPIVQNFSEEKYGNNAPFLKLASEMFNNIINTRSKYTTKVEGISSGTYLDEHALSSKEHINSSIAKFEDFKTAIEEYRSTTKNYISDFGKSISKLDVPVDYKDAVLKGFNNSIEKKEKSYEEYFNIEKDYCDKYIEILNFLKKSLGSFEVRNGVCVFYSDEKVDRYNKMIEGLNEIVQKEQDWNSKYKKDLNDIIEKYDKSFK